MKKEIIPAVVAALLVCSCGPRKLLGPSANFEFKTYEVVETASDDTREFVVVFVGGQEKGRTEIEAKSKFKSWRTELPEGNYPMRFEVWDSTDGVSGVRRSDDFQSRERFIRIEPGKKTSAVLKFYDKGRQNFLYVTRE